jgi:ubiquinone/menaquinone biosynthesis C-methylase UbiE
MNDDARIGRGRSYALGASGSAARRLLIQDAQFAAISERLLDRLNLAPSDRVVELGTGAGSFSRRILHRLGAAGTLVGIDKTQGLLDQAAGNLARISDARCELKLADIAEADEWLAEADVVVGRTVLHHLEIPEVLLGRWRHLLGPGTRLGFIEPEFRLLIGRLAAFELQGRRELAPLRRWAEGISRYYHACGLSPAIGATLAGTLAAAGYEQVQSEWVECPMDGNGIENILLYYDEIRDRYEALGIMSAAEIDRDKESLAALPTDGLPAIWGMYCVTCRHGSQNQA